jgi:hypothetical protein
MIDYSRAKNDDEDGNNERLVDRVLGRYLIDLIDYVLHE